MRPMVVQLHTIPNTIHSIICTAQVPSTRIQFMRLSIRLTDHHCLQVNQRYISFVVCVRFSWLPFFRCSIDRLEYTYEFHTGQYYSARHSASSSTVTTKKRSIRNDFSATAATARSSKSLYKTLRKCGRSQNVRSRTGCILYYGKTVAYAVQAQRHDHQCWTHCCGRIQ